ncbi:hypothetical protein L0657_05005 [Dyadobacter sp. CY345]|uniref:hypothetical protein n=1 Tax=Dyadobacter sp. CY345 TaxID=2909335 RepID=UPI001F33BDC9|nr:hypothetical protein [Dyadobacter sp. CY345]MCF2443307.1 hypothetical protein [Dyadobacter sp. CY345]
MIVLSNSDDYKHKFQRIVLGAKYDYALCDPKKSELPWAFIYDTQSQAITEQAHIYFKDKKVQSILVDLFQQY